MSQKKLNECRFIKERYLFSAEVDPQTSEIKSGSVRPIPNMLMLAESSVVGKEGKTALLSTNEEGFIDQVNGDFTLGCRIRTFPNDDEIKLYFPPLEVIAQLYAGYGSDLFLEKIEELIGKKELNSSVSVKININVKQEMLEKPEISNKPHDYVYEGIVIPRIKLVILAFSKSKFYERATVRIWRHNTSIDESQIISVKYDEGPLPFAFLVNESEIEEDLYNIRVTYSLHLKENIAKNNSTYFKDEDGQFYYELKEQIKFNVRLPTADICLINADPISLEEAIIKQFPDVFRDTIKITREMSSGNLKQDVRPGLSSYMHDISVRHEYSSILQGVITTIHQDQSKATAYANNPNPDPNEKKPGTSYASYLESAGQLLENVLTEQGHTDAALIVRLGFDSQKLWKSWGDFQDALSNQQNYIRRQDQIARAVHLLNNTSNVDRRGSALAVLRSLQERRYIEFEQLKQIYNLPEWFAPGKNALKAAEKWIEDFENTWLNGTRIGINPRFIHFGTRAFAAYNFAMDVKGVINSFLEVNEKKEAAEDSKAFFDETLALYEEKVGEAATEDFKQAQQQLEEITKLTSTTSKVTSGFKEGRYIMRTALIFEYDEDYTADLPFNKIKQLLTRPDAQIGLEGHASPEGTDHYNDDLSRRRVLHIKKQLEQNGIATDNMAITWHGETRPVRNEDKTVNLTTSRRVELMISVPCGERIFRPSREAMYNLEQTRQQQVAAYCAYEQAVSDFLWTLFDSACGVLTMVPQTMLIANCILIVREASKTMVSVAQHLDDLFHDNLINEYIAYNKLEGDLEKKSKYNRTFITNYSPQKGEIDYVKYLNNQYRIRAEVLNSLVKLLVRVAHEYDFTFSFLKNTRELDWNRYQRGLKKYQIDKFIELFVLNKEWPYPNDTYQNYPLDQFWMDYLGMEDIWEDNVTLKSNPSLLMTQFENYSKQALKKNHESHSISVNGMFLPVGPANIDKNMIPVNFQRCFPIHNMGSSSAEALISTMDLSYAGLDQGIYKYTAIYIKPCTQAKTEWERLDKYLQRTDNKPISPLDEIRIIIVLRRDEEYKTINTDYYEDGDKNANRTIERPLPICVKPIRVNTGWPDNEGPAYTDITQKFDEGELLAEEQAFKDHYGAIFYPRFKFGEHKIIKGTKPMSSSTVYLADWAQWNTNEQCITMHYQYEVKVGRDTRGTRLVRPISIDGQDADYYKLMKDGSLPVIDILKYTTGVASVGVKIYERLVKDAPNISLNSQFMLSVDSSRNNPIWDPEGEHVKDQHFEHLLFDKDFLKSKERIYQYPKLFTGNTIGAPLLRVRNQGPFFMSSKYAYCLSGTPFSGKNKGVEHQDKLDDFDWNDEVDLGILVFADKLDTQKYKEMKHRSDLLSYTANLSEESNGSTLGPEIKGQLVYVGQVEVEAKYDVTTVGYGNSERYTYAINADKSTIKLLKISALAQNILAEDVYEKHYRSRELIKMLMTDEKIQKQQMLEIIRTGMTKTNTAGFQPKQMLTFHVYASVSKLSYKAPAGHQINGLRPFGNKAGHKGVWDLFGLLDEDKIELETGKMHDFKFWVRNMKSQGESGLNDQHFKAPQHDDDDCFFYIPAPKKWTDESVAPWAANAKDPEVLKAAEQKFIDILQDMKRNGEKFNLTKDKLPKLPTNEPAVKWYFYTQLDKKGQYNYQKIAIKDWIEKPEKPEAQVFSE
ncbi:OmpA family protein [Zooshikella harenae]|uniref:OmpA family protein n=1 Tax=Zooshikella harenae TaxID=2827238 RepID=A0ABS5ZAI4_9GAMM|nr:OmpA family protein [Zooshikella harenae]MBU2711071.1 OmpA family protein [Zooshikella harenae]